MQRRKDYVVGETLYGSLSCWVIFGEKHTEILIVKWTSVNETEHYISHIPLFK